MKLETLEQIKQQAKDHFYSDCNFDEVIEHLIYEYEREEAKYLHELQRKTKKGNLFSAVNSIDKKFLAKICRDKMKNNEQPEFFKNLFYTYCVNNAELLTDAEIENARDIDIQTILETLTDVKIRRNRSTCPFCQGKNETKFSFKANLYCCFSCGEKGNSISLYKRLTGADFKTTVKSLNHL